MRWLQVALSVAVLVPPLMAHGGEGGGKYLTPSDIALPNSPSGGSQPPGPSSSGPPGALPGAGATSGVAGSRAGTGSGSTRGGMGARTGSPALDLSNAFDGWEYWWQYNKDAYLNLKSKLVKTSNVSGSLGMLTGRGRKNESKGSRRPTPQAVLEQIILPLVAVLDPDGDRDIVDSAVLAVARSAREGTARSALDATLPLLGHHEQLVQSSAALALGILRAPQATPTLIDLAADTSNGRRITGGGEVPRLVRSFAAVSLGLMNDPDGVPALIDLCDKLPDAERDLKASALVALGLMDNQASPIAMQYLLERLDDRKLDVVLKSYVPTSLGKLGLREALPPMLEALGGRDTDHAVRQSLVLGLGRLATMGDQPALDALMRLAVDGKDVITRHFCMVTLAKIGARDEDPQAHAEAHALVSAFLSDRILDPDRNSQMPWAAVASAIYARERPEAQPPIIERLLKAYDDEKNPSYRSALALSLGLLRVRGAAPMLLQDMTESKDYDFKGFAALALGLIDHPPAIEPLRRLCAERNIPPTFRFQVATALGLMSDEAAIPLLLANLDDAAHVGGAVAQALGLIGDASAIEPLQVMALDTNEKKLTRAFACVALGMVGERTDLPWNTPIAVDNNYVWNVDAINMVLEIY